MNSRPIFLSFILSLFLALCLAVGTPMAGSSEGVTSSEWQVSDLMALMAQVSSSRETFMEKKYMDVLAEPLVLSGNLSYVRPDRIERHVRSPYEERLLVDGDRLTLETPDGQKQITLHKYPVIWGFVESIRATLTGDEATLRRVYEIKLDGNRRQWGLTLKPRDHRLAEHVTSIKISGTGNRILRVETQEADGDRSVMTINENPA
jgi:outer membrane lipoprotein-sorting protein